MRSGKRYQEEISVNYRGRGQDNPPFPYIQQKGEQMEVRANLLKHSSPDIHTTFTGEDTRLPNIHNHHVHDVFVNHSSINTEKKAPTMTWRQTDFQTGQHITLWNIKSCRRYRLSTVLYYIPLLPHST